MKNLPTDVMGRISTYAFGHKAFERGLRAQQREEIVTSAIEAGIQRLAKRGNVRNKRGTTASRAKIAICANDIVTGVRCGTGKKACQLLRMYLLDGDHEPEDCLWHPTPLPEIFQCRFRWKLFCHWSKGGPYPARYPTRLLNQISMDNFFRGG